MEYDQNVMNRLKRAEGQIRGVIRMIDEEKGCRDVVTQLSAVRSSIDRVIALIVAENLVSCVEGEMNEGLTKDESIKQAIDLLLKSR